MPEVSPDNNARLQALFEKARAFEQSDGGDLTFDRFITMVLDTYENTLMEL